MMCSNKRKFLEAFIHYLDSFPKRNYGKCYFKLLNGNKCQGWILEIKEETFVFVDSGPLSREAPYYFEICNIDMNSFFYWDDEMKKWTNYPQL